jgi:hypothetical protein
MGMWLAADKIGFPRWLRVLPTRCDLHDARCHGNTVGDLT